jgi:hypothetical protein
VLSLPAPAAPTALLAAEARRRQRAEDYVRRRRELAAEQSWAASLRSGVAWLQYRVINVADTSVAAVLDESRDEFAAQSAARYAGLALTPADAAAAGRFVIDFHCSVAVSATQAATGWLFVTERVVVFDGETEGAAQPEHVRFSLPLSHIVSFVGAAWELPPLAQVPLFIQVAPVPSPPPPSSPQLARRRDAVLIFDCHGAVHRFWGFTRFFIPWCEEALRTLDTAWKAATQ